MKRKRCYKHKVDIRKVFGSTCDDCPKFDECYIAFSSKGGEQ